ncbi:MAG: STAS domain-containing protein [Dissulfurispiraceae bacterium]
MSTNKVTSKRIHDVGILYPQGYLNDIAGGNLMQECDAFIEDNIRKVVLNFRQTDYINTIGISVLLRIAEKVKQAGGELCLTELGKSHTDTFEMLGLSKLLSVFPDEDAAIKHLSP